MASHGYFVVKTGYFLSWHFLQMSYIVNCGHQKNLFPLLQVQHLIHSVEAVYRWDTPLDQQRISWTDFYGVYPWPKAFAYVKSLQGLTTAWRIKKQPPFIWFNSSFPTWSLATT